MLVIRLLVQHINYVITPSPHGFKPSQGQTIVTLSKKLQLLLRNGFEIVSIS